MQENGVLIIYTGGTIGAWPRDPNDVLSPLKPVHDIKIVMEQLPHYNQKTKEIRLDNCLIRADTLSLENPLDSANMQVNDWQMIAEIIYKEYKKYCGFVVLHGTDTLAYTASALSFMLKNISKPIIITGSQRPIGQSRSDAVQNLMTAIELAAAKKLGRTIIPEVSVFFDDRLLRGNRSTKVSSKSYQAFISPSFPSLARVGINLNVRKDLLLKPSNKELILNNKLDTSLICLDLYPGINYLIYKDILKSSHIKALVLKSFGAGNTPYTKEFLEMITFAVNSGKIVVNVSQCLESFVMMGKYESSQALLDLGVLSAKDMTFEATLTKLFSILGNYSDIEKIKDKFNQSLAGEMLKDSL